MLKLDKTTVTESLTLLILLLVIFCSNQHWGKNAVDLLALSFSLKEKKNWNKHNLPSASIHSYEKWQMRVCFIHPEWLNSQWQGVRHLCVLWTRGWFIVTDSNVSIKLLFFRPKAGLNAKKYFALSLLKFSLIPQHKKNLKITNNK